MSILQQQGVILQPENTVVPPIGVAPTPVDSPLDIPGCVLWLDGSDKSTMFQDDIAAVPVTADGDNIRTWQDKSGEGNDFVTLEDNEGVAFPDDGDGYVAMGETSFGRFVGPSFAGLTAGNLFIRMKQDTAVDHASPHHFGADNALGNHYPYGVNSIIYDSFGATARQTLSVSPVSYTDLQTLDLSASGGQQYFRVNETDVSQKAITVGFSAAPHLGWSLGGAIDGRMWGVAMYDTKLTPFNAARLRLYWEQFSVGTGIVPEPPPPPEPESSFVDSTTFKASGGTSIVITVPTHVEGDEMVVGIATRNNTINTFTGWDRRTHFDASSNEWCDVFTRTATDSEPATYTFVCSGGNGFSGLCAVFRGATYSGNTGVNTSRPFGTLNGVVHGVYIAFGSSGYSNLNMSTGVTGLTTVDYVNEQSGTTSAVMCYKLLNATEATGTFDPVYSAGSYDAYAWLTLDP